MAEVIPAKKKADTDDEDELPDFAAADMPAEASSAASSEGTPGTPAGSPNPKENSKKRAAVDLVEIYGATPGCSKNKVAMKELIQERKKSKRSKLRHPSESAWNRSGRNGSWIRRAS